MKRSYERSSNVYSGLSFFWGGTNGTLGQSATMSEGWLISLGAWTFLITVRAAEQRKVCSCSSVEEKENTWQTPTSCASQDQPV